MNTVLAARLLTGMFTPFLAPPWSDDETRLVEMWRKGELLPEPDVTCVRAIGNRLGLLDAPGIATSSGREGIRLALEGLGARTGAEVILPSYSCTGVVQPVIDAGLRPVLIDVDDELNSSVESVEAAGRPRVVAVVVPHLAGVWARDIQEIAGLAETKGWMLIEDVAQSLGLERDGVPAGTIGDAAVFSCGPGKPIWTTAGGVVLFKDPAMAERAMTHVRGDEPTDRIEARVRDFLGRYLNSRPGRGVRQLRDIVRRGPCSIDDERPTTPWHMSRIDALLALRQLEDLDAMIDRRREFADRWRRLLGEGPWRLAPVGPNTHTKFWMSFRGVDAREQAVAFQRALWRWGVETEGLYTPLHLRSIGRDLRRVSLPVTDAVWQGTFSLPVRPNLTAMDWRRIGRALASPGSAPGTLRV
jgi:dTDP-4-amino-4,6-dideoxygalactose transaminase